MLKIRVIGLIVSVVLSIAHSQETGALSGNRHRVIVSTDIGGTDPDDIQSMVHLLLYADLLDIEGLIASPYGDGRKQDILRVLDAYEKDFLQLKKHSNRYPAPADLRSLTKQGETRRAPYAGFRQPTAGSDWMIRCAKRPDERPLYLLVWGGLEDLAQALHDAPEILPKLRVYWIGGPNKKWSPDAYQYIADNYPSLWIIESNSSYRGWFTGGNQSGQWENEAFVAKHVATKGSLGRTFVQAKPDLKMGDTPSLGWLLYGNPEKPSQPGWGGQFVRAWKRPFRRFSTMPKETDSLEVFGIVEIALSTDLKEYVPHQTVLKVENQNLAAQRFEDGTLRVRFSPKAPKRYEFSMQSEIDSLNNSKGGITAKLPSQALALAPEEHRPFWWTDSPDPKLAEGQHHGAKTVSRWREAFLQDFAARMRRCQAPTHLSPQN